LKTTRLTRIDVLCVSILVVVVVQNSEAQSANLNVNNPQTEQSMKIQFAYQPQKPILDQPTELKFVVQNLKTGDYLRNHVANILVTHNSSGVFSNFRFSNLTVPEVYTLE
jgi:hypothetical protein